MTQRQPGSGDQGAAGGEWAERVGEAEPYPLEVWTDPASSEDDPDEGGGPSPPEEIEGDSPQQGG